MDEKDEIILRMLMINSRIPMIDIARELGITETAIRKRVKKLEENGAIKGYTTIVDPFFLGYESVALIGVDSKPEKILTVLKQIKSMKETKDVSLTTGDHMIMFEAWCRNSKELGEFLKRVEQINGVTKVCPAICIKRRE